MKVGAIPSIDILDIRSIIMRESVFHREEKIHFVSSTNPVSEIVIIN